jgi:hypothetical protein
MSNRIALLALLALLTTVAAVSAACGGSSAKSQAKPQAQETSTTATVDTVSACLMRSDVASVITNVFLEPDPRDTNANVLRIETTVAPGDFDSDKGGVAVLAAASDCGSDELHVAIAVIDRDGIDLGQS